LTPLSFHHYYLHTMQCNEPFSICSIDCLLNKAAVERSNRRITSQTGIRYTGGSKINMYQRTLRLQPVRDIGISQV
jgi:hypothetical protein